MRSKTVTYFTNPGENYSERHLESLSALCQTVSLFSPLSNVFEEWQEIKETNLFVCQNHVIVIFQVFYYLFCDQLNTLLCKHSLICNSLPLP